MRHPLDDADDSSAEIGCHLWKYWSISVRIARGEIDTQLAVRRRFSRPIKVALSGHIGHLRPNRSGGRYVSQPHIYCTGPHSLWLGVIRFLHVYGGPRGGGFGIILVGSTIHLLYKSGSHVQVFHIYQQKTGMQGSRCLLVGTGVNFPDARLIHASIRVHPGWWVGYLQAAPLGMTFWRSWWATDLSPGEGGFASHWGILTLQFFGTPPSSLF